MAKSSTSWTKGKSGGGKGRPRKLPELRARIEQRGVSAAIELALDILEDKDIAKLEKLPAAKMMLDWGLPKPMPTVSDGEVEKIERIVAALMKD